MDNVANHIKLSHKISRKIFQINQDSSFVYTPNALIHFSGLLLSAKINKEPLNKTHGKGKKQSTKN